MIEKEVAEKQIDKQNLQDTRHTLCNGSPVDTISPFRLAAYILPTPMNCKNVDSINVFSELVN